MRVEIKGPGPNAAWGRFDSERCVIALVLTPKDRENIANMAPDATIYCAFPDSMSVSSSAEIEQWVRGLKRAGG